MKQMLSFENYSVKKSFGTAVLQSSGDDEKLTRLLSQMVGFGYIPLSEGTVRFSADDVANFWSYAHEKILSDMKVEDYYEILGILAPYSERKPALGTIGAYVSESYHIDILWPKTVSTFGMSDSRKFTLDGLLLIDEDGKTVRGSAYPEYVNLFNEVSVANQCWRKWTISEKNKFKSRLIALRSARDFYIPDDM